MSKKTNQKNKGAGKVALEKRRKQVEMTASCGLLLLAIGLVTPFASSIGSWVMTAAMWIYAVGAVTYLVARIVNVSDPDESPRLRRLRRMESWAGLAFCIAAGFWFWHSAKLGPFAGQLAVMRDTILFSLVGAVIQIISAFLISSRARKEGK